MVYVRTLPMKSAKNTRDLGGYSTKDMKVTSFGKFIRSGVVTSLPKEEIQYLMDYGLKTVIDLREKGEIDKKPNAFSKNNLVRYYNIPISNINVNKVRSEDISAFISSDVSNYLRIVNNFPAINLVFNIMADNIDGVTLFNCQLGRDRTGIIAALLLMLASVSTDDIEIDYSISYTTVSKLIKIEKRKNYNLPSRLLKINQIMNYIIVKFGSIINYLLTIGLTRENIFKLKDKLIQN